MISKLNRDYLGASLQEIFAPASTGNDAAG